MEVKEIFSGVYTVDGRLATASICPGSKVYGEELVLAGKVEYRMWNPYRSKLAAAILNGLKDMRVSSGAKVLYLGAATGTTPSHVSDIVGNDGEVFCIELSERNMRELVRMCEDRQNLLPIMGDARDTYRYSAEVGKVDVLYQDVSSRDQADILIANSQMLKKGCAAYVAIKSQSISVSKRPEEVYKEFLAKASTIFNVLEKIDIMPFDKHHLFVVLEKK